MLCPILGGYHLVLVRPGSFGSYTMESFLELFTANKYSVMNFTKPLETQFPLLARARPWIYKHEYPRVILARRGAAVTANVMIARQHVEALFAEFGRSVPESLKPIMARSRFLLIDLDSIVSDQLRCYVFLLDCDSLADPRQLFDLFPWRDTPETQEYHRPLGADPQAFTGWGFKIDTVLDRVTEYKYYWYDPRDQRNHVTAFDSDGQWQRHEQEVRRVPVTHEDLDLFGLGGVIEPHAQRHVWVERINTDQPQQYITIMQRPL